MGMDHINPRTGMVVAVCSVFLVFGLMFTMSGVKGEKLGEVPLFGLGLAICLPGVAVIIVAGKTQGCTEWPRLFRREGGAPPRKALKEHGSGAAQPGEDSVSTTTTTTTVGETSQLIRHAEQDEVLPTTYCCYINPADFRWGHETMV